MVSEQKCARLNGFVLWEVSWCLKIGDEQSPNFWLLFDRDNDDGPDRFRATLFSNTRDMICPDDLSGKLLTLLKKVAKW